MSDETAFSKYIKSSADGYDSDIRYYRWFATADLSDKTETVNEILAARHSISPKMLYYESDGTTEMDVAAAGENGSHYRNVSGSKKQFRFDSYIRSYL